MTRRIASEERPKSWKEALHQSLFRSDRPLKEIADLCGVSRQYLQAASDEDQHLSNLSARHLPALARLCSDPSFLDYLEHQAGRVAFRLPSSHSDARGLGAALEEIGQWVQAHGAALEDGVVTAAEFEVAEKEAHEAIASVVAAVEQLRARVHQPSAPATTPTVVRIGVAR